MSFATEPITQLPMIIKDPQNDLDYTVSFVDFLAETGDTIGNIEVDAIDLVGASPQSGIQNLAELGQVAHSDIQGVLN